MTAMWLRKSLKNLPADNETTRGEVRERANNILRPAGALQKLDDVAIWMAGWQATNQPKVSRPTALVLQPTMVSPPLVQLAHIPPK